jgi:hypothetical protein
MSVPFKQVPGGAPVPDVDALMLRVRARVAAKLRSGADPPETFEEVRRIERELRGRTDCGPAPAADIARLQTSWDPLGPHALASRRAGIGSLVAMAKQLLLRLLRPVAAVVLARQSEFNGAASRLLACAVADVRLLEADNDALLRRLEELERGNLELGARCDELRAQLVDLKALSETGGRAGVRE